MLGRLVGWSVGWLVCLFVVVCCVCVLFGIWLLGLSCGVRVCSSVGWLVGRLVGVFGSGCVCFVCFVVMVSIGSLRVLIWPVGWTVGCLLGCCVYALLCLMFLCFACCFVR